MSTGTAETVPNRRMAQAGAKKNPKEFADSDARVEVGRNAWDRNTRKPARPAPLLTFEVSYNGKSAKVRAVSEREAWAKFCDKVQNWPSPRVPGITITKVADDEE